MLGAVLLIIDLNLSQDGLQMQTS